MSVVICPEILDLAYIFFLPLGGDPMRRPSPVLKTHTFALIAYLLRCLLFFFTPTARLQEFFTSLLSPRRYLVDHRATTLALHLTFWAVLLATFQVFQTFSSSTNLFFPAV